uniref:Uncharacterized protein n=1 Tax=Bionectria ochroleuca TaxID=29856 RepID=A0A8H7TS90_BIOOC
MQVAAGQPERPPGTVPYSHDRALIVAPLSASWNCCSSIQQNLLSSLAWLQPKSRFVVVPIQTLTATSARGRRKAPQPRQTVPSSEDRRLDGELNSTNPGLA